MMNSIEEKETICKSPVNIKKKHIDFNHIPERIPGLNSTEILWIVIAASLIILSVIEFIIYL